jgi:hypothetical protein
MIIAAFPNAPVPLDVGMVAVEAPPTKAARSVLLLL